MTVDFKNFLRASTAAAAVLAGMASAMAGGFALREQSAEGLGNAFAGAAAGGAGLGSMFWNPATITDKQGWNSSWNFTGILPNATSTAGVGTSLPLLALPNVSSNFAPGAILPASYSSYQLNDRFWVGLQTGAPFGLTTKNVPPYSGQIYGLTSKVFSTEITPTFGYKVNEFLSIGAGVRVQYFNVGLSQSLTPAAAAPNFHMKGDAWSIGYTLGATLKPGPNTEIGIGYRSQVRPNLEGIFEAPVPFVAAAVTPISAKLTLPDQVTVGVKHRLNDQWTLLAGYEWTHWSVFNRFPVINQTTGAPILLGGAPVTLAFQWRNGWYASAGAEYQWNPALKLRAGLGYESSPITTATRTVRLPDNNRVWATAGLSYQYSKKLSIDVSYAHIFVPVTNINIGPGHANFVGLTYAGKARAHFDMLSVGINYRWDDPAAPIVAKF